MKLDQLRKIIREEVRAAVKEELQEMLNEAVKHASKPDKQVSGYKQVKQKDLKSLCRVVLHQAVSETPLHPHRRAYNPPLLQIVPIGQIDPRSTFSAVRLKK